MAKIKIFDKIHYWHVSAGDRDAYSVGKDQIWCNNLKKKVNLFTNFKNTQMHIPLIYRKELTIK